MRTREEAWPVGKRKMGRPTTYTREIADEIIRRLSEGETLSAICRDDGMPARTTFLQWVRDDRDGLSAKYARARELGLEAMADELTEIADNVEGDPQRDRLRVDTRKWLLARLLAHTYGDRVRAEVTGRDGAPFVVQVREELPGDVYGDGSGDD